MDEILRSLWVILESRIIEVFVGAAIAIGFAIFVENLRRPKLRLSIGPIAELKKNSIPFRSLRILVSHKPLARGLRWMLRGPALQCKATISFHHLDGQNYLGRAMPARWTGTQEPVQLAGIDPQGQIINVLDPGK